MTGAGRAGLWAAVLTTVVVLLAAPAALGATTYTVTGTGDTSPTPTCIGTVCPTLRAAVNAADGDSGSIVQLGPGTYNLSQSALVVSPVSGSITIAGAGDGMGGTTIAQTHAGDRVIRIPGTEPVTVTGVMVTGGTLLGTNGGPGVAGADSFGGGIYNIGAPLTLDHVAVIDNTATGGVGGGGNAANPIGGGGGNAAGGIYSAGQLTLTGVIVSGNTASAGDGGDGYSGATGSGGYGGVAVGGIQKASPTGATSVSSSQITGNTATGGDGGTKGGGTNVGGGGLAIGAVEHVGQPLTITGSTVSDNSATGGAGVSTATNSIGGNATGGVYASAALNTALTITQTAFANNSGRGGSGGSGGFALGGAMTIFGMNGTVTGAMITGNHATSGASNGGPASVDGGGGVFIDPGATVAITNSTISQNVVSGGGNASGLKGWSVCGAGLGSEGRLTLVGDTIANNIAQGGPRPSGGNGGSATGAGMCLQGLDTTYVVNSTIAGNVAQGGGLGATGGGDAGGGGIELEDSSAWLANDTVAGNSAIAGGGGTAQGGDLAVLNAAGTLTLDDTIISGGTLTGGTSKTNCSATAAHLADKQGNLESTTPSECGLGAAGNLIGVDPKLGPLAGNGGPTQTMALGAGSPALSAGGACVDPSQTGSPALTTDQRGQPRTGSCDIGAFQGQRPANITLPAISGSVAVGTTLTCSTGTWYGDAPMTFSYIWSRGGTSISGAANATYTVASADLSSQLTCTVTASNPYASVIATSAPVTSAPVTSAPVTSAPVTSAPVTSAPVTTPPKPKLSHVSQSRSRWHSSSKPAKISSVAGSVRVGTTFRFKLNTPAAVKLTFKRCTFRAGKARCAHLVGSLSFSNARAGSRKIAFAGRLSKHKKLRPGTYSMVITATNASGKATSRALRFTIEA